MQEYWVNVYEYKLIKNTQFYSHELRNKKEAVDRARLRSVVRPDARCIYRIHVKMKPIESKKQIYNPRKARKSGVSHHWMDI